MAIMPPAGPFVGVMENQRDQRDHAK